MLFPVVSRALVVGYALLSTQLPTTAAELIAVPKEEWVKFIKEDNWWREDTGASIEALKKLATTEHPIGGHDDSMMEPEGYPASLDYYNYVLGRGAQRFDQAVENAFQGEEDPPENPMSILTEAFGITNLVDANSIRSGLHHLHETMQEFQAAMAEFIPLVQLLPSLTVPTTNVQRNMIKLAIFVDGAREMQAYPDDIIWDTEARPIILADLQRLETLAIGGQSKAEWAIEWAIDNVAAEGFEALISDLERVAPGAATGPDAAGEVEIFSFYNVLVDMHSWFSRWAAHVGDVRGHITALSHPPGGDTESADPSDTDTATMLGLGPDQ
ncbi:hypothetical protein DRE_03435 [Drechslerella stenobrocha 248]|uniref:Uncharacterized protein n=1 Tax=Drechslerella stenobrocha 248 TaxID=1043628 RepID=W7HSP5_9PEZI|nr:hypothetical protein DRE_03435 [Drechslerella stenobrocha 248]